MRRYTLIMLMSEILDAADITTPRAAIDFVAWAKGKADELGATREAKRYARSGASLPKKFYDEIYPLALFVEQEFGDARDPVVTPNLSNDNFDATIAFGGARRNLFVEITQAKEGYDDSLRLEVLARDGGVSLTGPIKVSGRRGSPSRIVKVQPEMVAHDDVLAKHLSLVEGRVRAKERRHYGKDFVLLVVVDDYLPFRGGGGSQEVERVRHREVALCHP